MKQAMVLAAIIAVSSVAFSDSGVTPSAAPVEVPQSAISFSTMKETWDKGGSLNKAILTGSWKLIAMSYSAACSYQSSDVYDPQGIKSQDGSIPGLEFKELVLPANDFTGKPAQGIFVVNILNMGASDSDQGPYEVSPITPKFSQWAYSSLQNRIGYYEYNCKKVENTLNKIICAAGLKVVDPNYMSDRSVACSKDTYGVIFGFIKE